MIVILEGPEGSGKTTLARALQERCGLEYHHEGVPPADVSPLQHYGHVLNSYRGKNVVLDRLALGERVYGPLIRTQDRLGDEGWIVFQRLVAALCAYQIICLPPPEWCHAHWNGREGELFTDPLLFYQSYAAYGYFAQKIGFTFDPTCMTYGELEKIYLGQQFWHTWEGSVIGNTHARYLIVGDQVTDPRFLDVAFFSTTGSSGYLTQALYRAGFHEFELAWMNARDAHGNTRLIPTSNPNGSPLQVIALGRHAQQTAEEQSIEFFSALPHPQYWKRFHHDLEAYAELLHRVRFKEEKA